MHTQPLDGPPMGYSGPGPYGPEQVTLHQRNVLAVQEMNRKGRVSPMPQAVQGAQPQQPGPAAEPGIKSEFGRMFSGIGSGVSGIGVPSPIAAAQALANEPDLPEKSKGKRRKKEDEDAVKKRAKGHHHHQYVGFQSYMFAN